MQVQFGQFVGYSKLPGGPATPTVLEQDLANTGKFVPSLASITDIKAQAVFVSGLLLNG
jgi:hypothetical protein